MTRSSHSPLQHVAFIMDGNRRWARQNNVPVFEGHRRGEDAIEPLVDASISLGISHLTFWAFSTENWRRSKQEVSFLLGLYRTSLDRHVDRFHQKNVRIRVIGDVSRFPADIQKKTFQWMQKTARNTTITVNIALNYGGRDEILRAIRTLPPDSFPSLSSETFSVRLDTAGQPDPDLLIRTGGEKRLSGFLLWQTEYTELYFTDTLWPDFSPTLFRAAIDDYSSRRRRFGR